MGALRSDTARAAQRIADELADEIGEAAAVAWVHVAALLRHAETTGLITLPDRDETAVSRIRRGVDRLATSHPALDASRDPRVTPVWDGTPDVAAAADLWRDHPPTDDPRRTDGYAVGDLYQALSAAARSRALCQTPRFVTDLLLDLSWDNAYEQWGVDTRMVDPACGTGHILVETFIRAWTHLRRGLRRSSRSDSPHLPWTTPHEDVVTAAVGAVHGVDIDPYAALVARYRLLALACRLSGDRRQLADAPAAWAPRVAAADALLSDTEPLLARGRYHCVAANPPYMTCKSAPQREAIRSRYRHVCTGKYSLAVPFEPLMHDLCVSGGWVARITANSFMKREFGRRLVEEYLPTVDLRWVVDTSGAYIPGHGTPTVILVSRNQAPTSATVRTVLGVRGEPSVPADPARGVVWQSITDSVHAAVSADRLRRHLQPGHQQVPVALPGRRAAAPVQPTLFDIVA